jgi:multidrug resistance efflux pump
MESHVTLMTVRYDSASARRHPRVTAPASVELDGKRYPTMDWSIGGFRISGYSGEARVDERRGARFFLNFQGFEIGFEAQARFCAIDEELQEASAEFVDLGQRESELLRHFMVGVATGEMATISDTLVHIDSPTSVASWGTASVAGADALAREGLKKRSVLRASLYFAIGPLLAGYAILAGYESFFRMEIKSAVVIRPTETVVAQGVGHLETMLVQQGQLVAAGQPLFTAVDEDHARDLETKKRELAMAEVELKAAQADQMAAKDRFGIYERIAAHKREIASERVRGLTIETESAEKNLARIETIVRAGLESNAALDEAKASFAKVQGELNTAIPELEVAKEAVRAAEHGSFYDGFRLIGELPEESIRLSAAQARVQIAENQLAATQEGSGHATYSVPFPGRVVRITKSPGSTVNRGETLALVERTGEEPRIYALLTQDQVTRIKLGERGTVRVPTLQQRFQAVVVRSDKAGAIPGGALSELLSNAERTRDSDPSGYIELELHPLTAAARSALRSGMPAIVNLPRRSTGSPVLGLSSWLP